MHVIPCFLQIVEKKTNMVLEQSGTVKTAGGEHRVVTVGHSIAGGPGNTVMANPHVVTVVQTGPGGQPPPGAPPGGVWIVDKYCGTTTWLVAIFLLPCVCCCPCDDRTVSRSVILSPLMMDRVPFPTNLFCWPDCSKLLRYCSRIIAGGGESRGERVLSTYPQ